MSSASSQKCPQCGAVLPDDAPAGLCPNCLMALNLNTDTILTGADALAAQLPLSPAELAPHFPQLEIIECLGRGGMGVVYKARQKSLNRIVALKLLAPERVADAKFAQRFTHEAQALATLNHPSIVTIYDFGQAGGFYFLLMEFVDGVNLRQALKAGRFTPEQALTVVPPVCEALQYAHEHGIVHRDIKPENLLLDKDGRVKIADFGIAKMLGADGSDVGIAESQPLGTPQYMAPEQKEHRRTDHRADIYSLGVVLYELLTGELPGAKLQPPSRKVQIDVRLDEIVLRALEVRPELRYQTAAELRTQLVTIVQTPAGVKGSTAPSPSWITSLARSISVKRPAMRGAWAGLLVCVLIVGGTAVVTSLIPRMYRSTALIQVSSEATSPINTLPQVRSRTVLNQVAKELDLARQWVPRYGAEDLTEDGLYRLLKRKLDVRLRTGGTVFEVSYYSEDPDEAAQFANKVVEVFRAQPFGNGTLVLKAAEREARPIRPNRLLNMLLGVGAGIFLGVIVGMLVGLISAWRANRRQPSQAKEAGTRSGFWRSARWINGAEAGKSSSIKYAGLLILLMLGLLLGFLFMQSFARSSRPIGVTINAVDPNWVSVSGQKKRLSESAVSLTWEVLASRPGTARFAYDNKRIAAQLQLVPNSKLYATTIHLRLTRVSTNRVRLVWRTTVDRTETAEFPGNFRHIADERIRTGIREVNTVRGASIELCQIQGKAFTVQVDGGMNTVAPAGPVTSPQIEEQGAVPGFTIPTQIDFKVLRVENPPGTRNIILHFHRDTNFGLGIEVSQNVMPSQVGQHPGPGHRDWQQKYWVAVDGPRTLTWVLPKEFTEVEAHSWAKEMEREWKGTRPLPDGAVPEFANVKHREGWTYILMARVLREPGAPLPPPPGNAVLLGESVGIIPTGAVVRIEWQRTAKDGRYSRIAAPLTFKTAEGQPGKLHFRWYTYKSKNPLMAGRWFLDIHDEYTGIIFHRLEDDFAQPVKFDSPIFKPENVQTFALPQTAFAVHKIIHAELVSPPDQPITKGWDVMMTVGPKPSLVPEFQLPSTRGRNRARD